MQYEFVSVSLLAIVKIDFDSETRKVHRDIHIYACMTIEKKCQNPIFEGCPRFPKNNNSNLKMARGASERANARFHHNQ